MQAPPPPPPSPPGSPSPFPIAANTYAATRTTEKLTAPAQTITTPPKLNDEPVILAPEVIAAFVIGVIVSYKVQQIISMTMADAQVHLFRLTVALVLIWVADLFFKHGLKSKANWKLLHCCANFGVVIGSFKDVVFAFTDPHLTCVVKASPIPCTIVGALHLYHLMAYSTNRGDWFHHILFCGTLVPIGLLSPNPIVNVFSFFLSGLPGGIDYLMLALVKHKKMSRSVEKVWNARINVWLRSPGCMAAAGIMFAAIKYGPESICTKNPQMGLILGGLIVFNGQYYQQVVVGNTYRKVQHYSS